jgi:hypothetical protein
VGHGLPPIWPLSDLWQPPASAAGLGPEPKGLKFPASQSA